MRRAQEPWDRVMRGMGILQGMKPGELIGGYGTTVPNAPPEAYQQPTSSGKIMDLLTGIGTLGQGFNWWADGGYVEKPKEYNAGGIVSGIVPINMATGGDAVLEEEIPEWVTEAMESGSPMERKAAMDYLSTMALTDPDIDPLGDIAEEQIEKAGMSGTGLEALLLSALAAGQLRKGNIKGILKRLKRKEKAFKEGRVEPGKEIVPVGKATVTKGRPKVTPGGATSQAGRTPVPPSANPLVPVTATAIAGTEAAKRTIGQRALDLIKRRPFISGAAALGGGSLLYNYLTDDDEEEAVTADPEQFDEYLELKRQQMAEAETKKERDELMADIIRTGNRLSEGMSAKGYKEVTLGDAARIFGEERMDLPAKEAAELAALEETAKASGMSLEEYLQLSQQEELALRGQPKEKLAETILQTGYARYGTNFEDHPDHISQPGGTKSSAQIRLEMMNALMAMDYQDLASYLSQLESEISVSAKGS
jgi:hypothetical protein